MIRQLKGVREVKLLHDVREGKEAAFEALFNCYKDRVYAFSYKILKSRDLADDMVIEVFTKVWERRASIHPGPSFQAWLFRITKNHIINFLNKASLDSRIKEQLSTSANYYRCSTEEEVIYNEYLTIAEQAISQMPKQRRRVFRLKSEQGMTYDQIAVQLGISKNTVKSHLLAATAHLRNVINVDPDGLVILPVLLSSHFWI